MLGSADAVCVVTCVCTWADVDEWLMKTSGLLAKKAVKERQSRWLLCLQLQRG